MAFALVIALAIWPGGSTAAEFLVDSESDVIDANPGDGVCDTGADECTLRAAVMEANAFHGFDTVLLPAGNYELTIPLPGGLANGSNDEFGDLDILGDLRIEGDPDDPSSVVIRGASDESGTLAVVGVQLDLVGVKLLDGQRQWGDPVWADNATLSLMDVIVDNGQQSVYARDTDVAVFDSVLAGHLGYFFGVLVVENGDLLVEGSRFENNGGTEQRSALSATGGQVTIRDSEFVNNGAVDCGIVLLENALIQRTRFEGNTTGNCPTFEFFDSRIEESTFIGNQIHNDVGVIRGTSIELVDSTVSGNPLIGQNTDEDTYAVELHGDSRIVNTTISGNGTHAAVVNRGNLTVEFSTIVENSPPAGQLPDQAALDNAGSGQLFLKGSIVADNAQDCADPTGGIQSLGYNVIGVIDGCPALVPAVSDVVGTQLAPVDPRLKPLAPNGGLTQTHALLGTSPAKDLVPVPDCTVDDDLDPATPAVPLLVDQRGKSRPKGPGCDAGAFERIPPSPVSCGMGPELALVLAIVGWARISRSRRPRS